MLEELNAFIVRAKSETYVGSGQIVSPSRLSSHDLQFVDGNWIYRDSYFGGADFLGQEVVWRKDKPVWVMNYYGYILRADLINAQQAGATIKSALTELYKFGRFLGDFEWVGPHGRYCDHSTGTVAQFNGREEIWVGDDIAYALDYHGGLVKP